MDLDKLIQTVREVIIGEIKEEFRDFRASVTGELAGFRLAIESISARMGSLELRQAQFESEIKEEIRNIRLALSDTNKRIDEVNIRIDETNKRIDETHKKIDELRVELKGEIMQNTHRIDETNKRIDEISHRIDSRLDALFMEVSNIKGELKRALSNKEYIDDILRRVQRLERRMYEAA